jgi:hypothetical protein
MVAQEAAELLVLDQVDLTFLVKEIQVAQEDLEVGPQVAVVEQVAQGKQQLMEHQ